jgi:hypothetical protein
MELRGFLKNCPSLFFGRRGGDHRWTRSPNGYRRSWLHCRRNRRARTARRLGFRGFGPRTRRNEVDRGSHG